MARVVRPRSQKAAMKQLFTYWNEYCEDKDWWNSQDVDPNFTDFMNWYEQRYVER